jgi:hypothetical protein
LFEEAGFSPKSFAYLGSFLARKSADEFILEKKFDSSVVSFSIASIISNKTEKTKTRQSLFLEKFEKEINRGQNKDCPPKPNQSGKKVIKIYRQNNPE